MAWQRYKDICKSFIELYFIEKLTFLDKKITLNEAFKTHQRVASQPNRSEPIAIFINFVAQNSIKNKFQVHSMLTGVLHKIN